MKLVFAVLLLPFMALALRITPPSNSSTRSVAPFGFDTTHANDTLVHRQIDPKASGSACSDEGAWFCMSDNFQRCASGEWSTIQECAPGTQCEPLGLTHNASQPAFGIYDGSGSGTVTPDTSTTAFSVEPVTKTTTTNAIPTASQSTSSSTKTLPTGSTSTKSGTSPATSSSSSVSPFAPKADTSGGAHMGGASWSIVGIMYMCLAACVALPRMTVG